ncbi:MAG: TonB-dependent receptor [Proteobacteria bacterium]|nr:MAG: TonB-dependent receptor [Pseudomonadota bacterium]
MPGRFLANARLGWSDPEDKWTAALEVQNLFDKYYFMSVSDVTTSLGLVTGAPGLPRTWLASIERKF